MRVKFRGDWHDGGYSHTSSLGENIKLLDIIFHGLVKGVEGICHSVRGSKMRPLSWKESTETRTERIPQAVGNAFLKLRSEAPVTVICLENVTTDTCDL